MKHNLQVTLILIGLYLLAQYLGLFVTSVYLEESLPFNIERPQLDEKYSFLQIFITILIVTFLVMFIVKFEVGIVWKILFFISIWYTVMLSLSSFLIPNLALVLGLVAGYFKIFQKNIVINNLIELFVYGGLAAIFVPVLTLTSIFFLLILISIYDMIAVWKTKHMVKMAEFQTKQGIFPGFMIPYSKNRVAILGGGDVGFPLIFTGVVYSLYGVYALVVPLTVTISLFFLFYFGEKSKYYPAMPFLSIGCFVGYGLVRFLSYVL